MADGDIRYKFMADAAAAERAIAQLEKKYESLEGKIKGVARSSKKSSDDGIAGLDKLALSAGKYAAGMFGAGAVVSGVTRIWTEYAAKLDSVIQREAQVGKNINVTSMQTGVSAVTLQKFSQSVGGVLPEQALAAFQGVQSGAPQVPLARQEEMARAFAAMSPALAPVDASGKVQDASLLQEFSEIGATLSGFFKGKSAGDLADLTTAVQASVGAGNIGQLKSGKYEQAIDAMMANGMSAERALATASVGIDSGLSARQLLGKGVVAGLDQDKIAGLAEQFRAAQENDAAQQLLRDAAVVNPVAFVNQQSFANGQEQNRSMALETAALDSLQEERWQKSKGFFGGVSAIAQSGVENFVHFIEQLGGTSDNVARAEAQSKAAQQTERMIQLLEQIAGNARPGVRREAHAE